MSNVCAVHLRRLFAVAHAARVAHAVFSNAQTV